MHWEYPTHTFFLANLDFSHKENTNWKSIKIYHTSSNADIIFSRIYVFPPQSFILFFFLFTAVFCFKGLSSYSLLNLMFFVFYNADFFFFFFSSTFILFFIFEDLEIKLSLSFYPWRENAFCYSVWMLEFPSYF